MKPFSALQIAAKLQEEKSWRIYSALTACLIAGSLWAMSVVQLSPDLLRGLGALAFFQVLVFGWFLSRSAYILQAYREEKNVEHLALIKLASARYLEVQDFLSAVESRSCGLTAKEAEYLVLFVLEKEVPLLVAAKPGHACIS